MISCFMFYWKKIFSVFNNFLWEYQMVLQTLLKTFNRTRLSWKMRPQWIFKVENALNWSRTGYDTLHYLTRENLLCHLKIRKISTFSLLHHFCLCPLFSSNMSLSMFWLLRRSLTTILQRIYEWRKESCWVVSNLPAKCVFKHFRQIKG